MEQFENNIRQNIVKCPDASYRRYILLEVKKKRMVCPLQNIL